MKPDLSKLSKQEKLDLIDELLESVKYSERVSYTEQKELFLAKKEWEQYQQAGVSYPLGDVLESMKKQSGGAES